MLTEHFLILTCHGAANLHEDKERFKLYLHCTNTVGTVAPEVFRKRRAAFSGQPASGPILGDCPLT